MMRPLGPVRRALLLALSIVQMGAPGLAAVADAALSTRAGSAEARTHVEDHTRRSCAAVHPDECALCQLLSHLARERTADSAPSSARQSHDGAARQDVSISLAARVRAAERPRAPPALS